MISTNKLVGEELVGVTSQYNTIRYTRWPGQLGTLILSAGIPDGFKKGDRVKLSALNVVPSITQQLVKHIGCDLMIAKTEDSYLKQTADNHWLMKEGGLFNLKDQRWLTW